MPSRRKKKRVAPPKPEVIVRRLSVKLWLDVPPKCLHCGGQWRREIMAARVVCLICARDLHIEEGPPLRPLTDSEIDGDGETFTPAQIAPRKCHCGRATKTPSGCCSWCRYRNCDLKKQPKLQNERHCLRCDRKFKSDGPANRLCGWCRGLED